MFIRDEIYAKAGNLHDASVEAVGAICRQLPWKRYMRVLQYFLARLTKSIDNQKLAVRSVLCVQLIIYLGGTFLYLGGGTPPV